MDIIHGREPGVTLLEGITVAASSTDDNLVLEGVASIEAYQDALEAVRYVNNSPDPTADVDRSIRVEVVDEYGAVSDPDFATIRMSETSDTYIGGPGNDMLFPNEGNDVFVFGPGSGADTIREGFSSGLGTEDVIDLRGFGFDSYTDDVAPRISSINDDQDTLIDLDAGDQITLIGVASLTLTEDDFLL